MCIMIRFHISEFPKKSHHGAYPKSVRIRLTGVIHFLYTPVWRAAIVELIFMSLTEDLTLSIALAPQPPPQGPLPPFYK